MRASKILQAAKALKALPTTAAAATVIGSPAGTPGPTALQRPEPNAPKPAARDKKPPKV